MNEQTIHEQHQAIVGLLKQKRLREAQTQLESFMAYGASWPLRNRLEQARTSYQYMLQYMKQGMEDVCRQKLYFRLQAETWTLADQVYEEQMDKVSYAQYHLERIRYQATSSSADGLSGCLNVLEAVADDLAVCLLTPDNTDALQAVLHRHEDTCRQLFHRVWTNSEWTPEEADVARHYLDSRVLRVQDLCLMVGAVMLSLCQCFDSRKLSWLFDAYQHTDVHVSQRALVSMALVLHIHVERLPLHPDLMARISLLDDDGSLGQQLNRVYIQLLRSRETEKINKKMQEEIIPEMMKNVDFMRQMRFGLEEGADDNDRNPDWEKAMAQSGLNDRIYEMNEWQMEGADVYMSSFSQLKKYPFFDEVQNWFYPFDRYYSGVVREFGGVKGDSTSLLDLLLLSSFFCDSDKYSLCFTLMHIPQAQRRMMFDQMAAQNMSEMLLDESKSLQFQQYGQRPDVVSNQYIHDLYRFFKLNPHKGEFRDVFAENFALHHIPALRPVLGKPEFMKPVADFCFSKNHLSDALSIYQELIAMGVSDVDVYQKTGFCLQKQKSYAEAIEAYRKADVLKPDHIWTLRHLAYCYRQSGHFEAAHECYAKVASMQPQNGSIVFAMGGCLAESGRYEEALQAFFKLDFMENDCLKAWRAIGWCSLACGKYEQAMKYCLKVLSMQPVAADYLNIGHVTWCAGKLAQAVDYYAQVVALSGSKEAFLEMFDKDRAVLIAQGIAEEDIPLVLDMI